MPGNPLALFDEPRCDRGLMLKALLPDWRPVNSYSQIRLKWQGDKLLLILPTEAQWRSPLDWLQVTQEFKARLNDGLGSALPTTVELQAQDRLLDGRQLQTLVTLLKEVGLQLQRVHTSRRQTAVAAATAASIWSWSWRRVETRARSRTRVSFSVSGRLARTFSSTL
ncbi:MAG: hypothetical protein HC890_03435 [Chloroflexaceae bacterium]|nr:hypothetical protein [Chloroflexaceae bacterium]